MSLHVLADHMASKGRGGDSMLVHMTPSEVHALQQLAEKHGTTLTINPETGLPEAFSLKNLLKAVAPVALGAFLGPAGVGLFSTAAGAGLAVGAGTAALTGDIGKGLSAGLGAYGGFGLGEGIAGLGESALSAGNQSAAESARLLAQAGSAAPEAAQQFMAANAAAPYTASEAMRAGVDKALASPGALLDKVGYKTAAAAAAPLLLSTAPKTEMPGASEPQGYIRQYYYDPVSRSAKPLEPIATKDWGSRTFEERVPYIPAAAEGGIVALAQGGAVGMADGGYTSEDIRNYLAANPGMSDTQIAAAMDQYKVTPAQMAAATGLSLDAVQGRYNAAEQNISNIQNTFQKNFATANAGDIDKYIQGVGGIANVQAALQAGNMQDVYGTSGGGTPFTSAADLYQLQTGGSFAPISSSINKWLDERLGTYTTPQAAAAARAQAEQAMVEAGMNEWDVLKATGKTLDQLYGVTPSTKVALPDGGLGTNMTYTGEVSSTPQTYAPEGTTNPYGNTINPGDLTRNANKSVTVQPNIPGRPYGGFTGIQQLKNAYTAGGGSLGQVLKPTTTYQNTGMSAKAYDYLMGKGVYPVSETGIGKNTRYYWGVQPSTANTANKYWRNPQTGLLELNPNYVDPALKKDTLLEKAAGALLDLGGDSGASTGSGNVGDGGFSGMSNQGEGGPDGIGGWARGGIADVHYNLGGYSDGGRLLRGPGDGVSDSIPATIGDKQPARLADGEFVVPARVVSELGNGSTEAGARKLYAMMDRVQKARGKTTGKGKVAKDTNADKYLPA